MIILRGHPAPRGIRRAVIAGVVSVVVLAGCGAAEKLSPRVAVREAAKRTANQQEGTFTFSLVGSDDDMNLLFNDGQPLTDEDREGLELIRGSHIAITTANGKFAVDVKAADLDHAFELRYVDKKLYVRADVAGFAALSGTAPEEINEGIAGLASQEGFGFLSAAVAGKWISADFSTLSDLIPGLTKQIEDVTGGSLPAPENSKPSESEFQAIKDAIGKALSEDVSIKELKSDDAGDHYLATVSSLRSFYAKVTPIIQPYMQRFAGGENLPPASAVPDRPANLDVWIKSGRVSRLEVELGQFWPTPPAGAGRVAIRLDINREAGTVTAPPDAVNVNFGELVGRFFSQMLSGAGGLTYD